MVRVLEAEEMTRNQSNLQYYLVQITISVLLHEVILQQRLLFIPENTNVYEEIQINAFPFMAEK